MDTDEVELSLTEKDILKAKRDLENAKGLFKNVNIIISDVKIILRGNDYEELKKCKWWFLTKTGQLRLSKRSHLIPKAETENILTNVFTTYITYEKLHVNVGKQDLLSLDGQVDCFVNTTKPNLDTTGQVSNVLKRAGGKPYESACENIRQAALKLKTTDCLITGGGDLRTRYVIHAFCPNAEQYNDSKPGVERAVYQTVLNCLRKAEETKLQSIAFPFLSTGKAQVDVEVCSQQYARAVIEFSRLKESKFLIDTVYFIDTDKNKVERVNTVFKQTLPSRVSQLLELPRNEYNDYTVPMASAASMLDSDFHDMFVGSGLETEGVKKASVSQLEQIQETVNVRIEPPVTHIKPDSEEIKVRSKQTPVDSQAEQVAIIKEMIGKYQIVFETGDIRDSETTAIVSPENDGENSGGFLAIAIKCAFRLSLEPKKLQKLKKKGNATTEHRNEKGDTQYIFHVLAPVWIDGYNETEFEERLKKTMEMIFDKLQRHKARNIQSISIPLLGINSVGNEDMVGKCCKWQIVQTIDILRRSKQIPKLEEVRLINRCYKITNTLYSEMKACLALYQ